MSFKVGDIVKLKYDTCLNFINMKEGTEGVVLEVKQTGNISLYVKGKYNRVCTVAPCEIEHFKPSIESSNPGFITKEEFTANAEKMYAAFSHLSNRVLALEDQRKEEEILQVKKPLFEVGDYAVVKDTIFLSQKEKVFKGQSVKVLKVDSERLKYLVRTAISDLDKGFVSYQTIVLHEYQLEATTDDL